MQIYYSLIKTGFIYYVQMRLQLGSMDKSQADPSIIHALEPLSQNSGFKSLCQGFILVYTNLIGAKVKKNAIKWIAVILSAKGGPKDGSYPRFDTGKIVKTVKSKIKKDGEHGLSQIILPVSSKGIIKMMDSS